MIETARKSQYESASMKVPEKYPPELILIMDLSLTTNPVDDLKQILAQSDIATIIISNKTTSPSLNRELITTIQSLNIAVLIEDNVPLANQLGADGIHLSSDDEDMFEAALNSLDENSIIGITAGESRHKAMVFAESGCSYLAINLANNDDNTIEEFERPPEIDWWVQLFGTPCVAWNLKTVEETAEAINQQADFLALAPELWQKEKPDETFISIRQLISNAAKETISD